MSFHPLVTITVRRHVISALRRQGKTRLEAFSLANSISKETINNTVFKQLSAFNLKVPDCFAVTAHDTIDRAHEAHDDINEVSTGVAVSNAGDILKNIIAFFAAHPEVIQAIVQILISIL